MQMNRKIVQYRDNWRTKASEVVAFMEDIGVSLEELLFQYEGKYFVDGKGKAPIFRAVLGSQPNSEQLQYLDDRCGAQYSHFRDSRSGAEYAADLIISWVQEDALLSAIQLTGIEVELDGNDKYRELLKPNEISSASDFLITSGSVSRKLEVAYDSTGYWRKTGNFDLRDAKFDRLKAEKSLLLGVAVSTREAFVIDLINMGAVSVIAIPHHPIYKKPAKALVGIDKLLMPFGTTIQSLKKILQ